MKLEKEKLNELLYYIRRDNKEYALILKLVYIYGRNIGEVLRLKKEDISLKSNTIDFNLPTKSFSYMLHDEIKQDLLDYIESKELENTDYIFINIDDVMETRIKRINYYLNKIINELNKEVFLFKCPILSTKDFKILRGQHLFLDGANIQTITQLYQNINITTTKKLIGYKEMLKLKFPCTTIDQVFQEYTDLNLYIDERFNQTDLITVCNVKEDLLIEIDYENSIFNIISNGDREIINKVQNLDSEELSVELKKLAPGNYKFIDGLRFVKN